MARIRSIKPQFFTDEDLNEIPIEAHFLFAGLFGLADRDGRLEDKPKTIKISVFPFRDKITYEKVNELLLVLAKPVNPFILRYASEDKKRYIQIVNFKKHQRITGKEADTESIIPEPKETDFETTGKQQGNNRETTEMTGKEGNKEGNKERKGTGINSNMLSHFDSIWKNYPKQIGRKQAEKYFVSSVKTEKDLKDIEFALEKYLSHIKANNTDPQYIKHGSTWFNNWRDWINYSEPVKNHVPRKKEEWEILPPPYVPKVGDEIIKTVAR